MCAHASQCVSVGVPHCINSVFANVDDRKYLVVLGTVNATLLMQKEEQSG